MCIPFISPQLCRGIFTVSGDLNVLAGETYIFEVRGGLSIHHRLAVVVIEPAIKYAQIKM